tara:strand:+ start:185 stop:1924 length:1740 start_codon:yes stop_codon:yes gene_type:complete
MKLKLKMYEAKIKEMEKENVSLKEEIAKKSYMKKIRKIKTLDPVNTLTIKEIKEKKKYFKKNRPEQYDVAVKVVNKIIQAGASKPKKNAHIIIVAEEKSGKREISEIISILLQYIHRRVPENKMHVLTKTIIKNVYPTLLHVCGLVRKSCDEQYEELRQLGIYAQPISIKTNGEDYLNSFNKQKGKKTGVIVLDELDYASAVKSKMEIYIREPNSHIIAMSSTAWEATKSAWSHDDDVIYFKPSDKYCGGAWFCENDLVHKPTSFILDNEFSPQAIEIMTNIRKNKENERNVIVVRLPSRGANTYTDYKNIRKNNITVTRIIEDNEVNIHQTFIDATNQNSLENEIRICTSLYKDKGQSHIQVILICGKYTRSAELTPYVKSRLHAWHDSRDCDGSLLQALSQAVGRVKHYKTEEYPEGHSIHLYCDKKVVEYWLDPKTREKEIKKISSRIKSTKAPTKNYDYKEFETFEHANAFKKEKFGGVFDQTAFSAREKCSKTGRIKNNIRGEWKIINWPDEEHYSYGLSGSGYSSGDCRLLVSYDGIIPKFTVIWNNKEDRCTGESKRDNYKHKPSKLNAYAK